MFAWAVDRECVERSPFKRGDKSLVKEELEDNRRHRRLSADEEEALMTSAPDQMRLLVIAALDTGMRQGEMLALTWADVEARSGWLRVRGETAKSGKTRWVPISTNRLHALLDYLRLDVEGQQKRPEALVFSNVVGEPIGDFRGAWKRTLQLANITDLRWHDLRHEYASRLVERGTPLSQVRDLLGHASITTTERYDNQRPEALMEAAKRLETGQTFTIPSQQAPGDTESVEPETGSDAANVLEDDELSAVKDGVGNGVRTL